jgi:uncharacterized membrane protein YgcG
MADQQPPRLAREALFLLVFGSRPPIKSALLQRLGAMAVLSAATGTSGAAQHPSSVIAGSPFGGGCSGGGGASGSW